MKDQLNPGSANPGPEDKDSTPRQRPRGIPDIAKLLGISKILNGVESPREWETDPLNPMIDQAMMALPMENTRLPRGTIILHRNGAAIVLGPYEDPYTRLGPDFVSLPEYGMLMDTKVALMDLGEDPEDKDFDVAIRIVASRIAIPVNQAVLDSNPKKTEVLREIEASYNKKYKFKTGDKVRWKKHMSLRKMKGVFTFIKKLSKKVPMIGIRGDADHSNAEIMDCIVMCTLNDVPSTFALDSRLIEPAE